MHIYYVIITFSTNGTAQFEKLLKTYTDFTASSTIIMIFVHANIIIICRYSVKTIGLAKSPAKVHDYVLVRRKADFTLIKFKFDFIRYGYS